MSYTGVALRNFGVKDLRTASRPATEQGEASASLSEGTAQVRPSIKATVRRRFCFCFHRLEKVAHRLETIGYRQRWGISSIGRVRALQA